MQRTKNTTVRVYGLAGRLIAELLLPASAPLVALEALRAIGAVRLEVRA